jgi:hypothetical protein
MLTERFSCTVEVKDWKRTQAAEMNFLRSVKGCSKRNKTRNECMIISRELVIFSLNQKYKGIERGRRNISKERMEFAFLNKPQLIKCEVKAMWDDRGRDGQRHARA